METKRGGSTHDIKEKYVSDEVVLTRSSSLIKEQKTALSKLLKEMARICYIHDMHVKNQRDHQGFRTKEDLSRTLQVVLDDPTYEVQELGKMNLQTIMCRSLMI